MEFRPSTEECASAEHSVIESENSNGAGATDDGGAIEVGAATDGGADRDSGGGVPVWRSAVEEFKLQVNNLPKYCSPKELKKFLRSTLGEDEPKKIYSMKTHAYILFGNEIQRDSAMQILNGKKFKGSKLRVKRAAAIEDPISAKRLMTKPSDESFSSILDVCIPLHAMPECKNSKISAGVFIFYPII